MLVQRGVKNEVINKREEGEYVLAKIDLKIKDHVEKRRDEEEDEKIRYTILESFSYYSFFKFRYTIKLIFNHY